MAKKLFEKGNSGGPGRPKLPSDLHQVSILTRTEFEARASMFMQMPIDEVGTYITNPKATAIERMIASIVIAAADGGDHQRLDFLLNRTIGKVVEKVETKHTLMIQKLEQLEKLTDVELAHQARAALVSLEQREPE
jgi:hypothetical protein